MALIPPEDAKHFIRVYQDLLTAAAKTLPKTAEDFDGLRRAIYEPKARKKPLTDDPDLLAALQTGVYGDIIVGRHLARYTEMIGPGETVYRVKGLTTEPKEMVPPWVFVKTAVLLYRGHWIWDGLFQGGNILLGRNMIREYTEIIREAPVLPSTAVRKAGARKAKAKGTGTAQPKENKAREERIAMEIVVDAYNESERAMGWYCYLENTLRFPFSARCVDERPTSPLEEGAEVEVVGMAPSEECEHGMFVEIRWGKRTLAVPLEQLKPLGRAKATKEAVEDWQYWVGRGYGF